ncbi:uncharacterized protein IUM83_10376 [Phytophthora cinnamomi]|uniref:uncharacterized protein n=1 Tax=Phytophthora cinnamomi TaxID=4785 RepID=UPI00355A1346|nr:hypothetical protein IUM83_10376 [Phytophthora cinnamomi]
MKAASETGSTASCARPPLAHLENILHELTRCQERKSKQKAESASESVKQKLLSDQLRQAQDELATAQASRAKLCEEIGALKQTKEHQAKQLDKYRLDWQASRESQAAMAKKMEALQKSTRATKQQYIRSLASRIKTSALVLQQLNATNGTSFSFHLTEKCSEWETNKRKRSQGERDERLSEDGDKDPSCSKIRDAKQYEHPAEVQDQSKHAIEELQNQVAKLKTEYSALNDKYKSLVRDHSESLADREASVQDIQAKQAKIEELTEMLENSRSRQRDTTSDESTKKDEDRSDLEGRLKMLEENLAQMNGYADQLEMVIAQCPSCTVKLQSESTQDSTTK